MAEDRKWRGDQSHGPGDRNRQAPQAGDGGDKASGCPFVAVPVVLGWAFIGYAGYRAVKLWKTRT